MSRVLRRNLLVLYGAEVVAKVLSIFVFGYLSRTLLEARFGDLQFALGLLFLVNLVIDAGLANYGAREAAQDPSATERLVGQIFAVRAALVVFAAVGLFGIAFALQRDRLAEGLILLQLLVVLPVPAVLSWVFQARDQMVVVALSSLIRQGGLALGVLLLVRDPSDVWIVPVADSLGLAVAVVLQVILFHRMGGRIRPFSYLAGVSKVVVEAAPLAASSVVWALRLFSPLLALGLFATSGETGIFGAGHQLVTAAHMFVWLYFFNLLPSMSRAAKESGLVAFGALFESSMAVVSWGAILAAAVGAALAPVIIPIVFGADFREAAGPFSIMVWMLAVAFVSGHHRFGLIALGHQERDLWANAAGAVVSVAACLLLGSSLTPILAASIFVSAEVVTLLAAIVLLRPVAPSVSMTQGIAAPLGTLFVAEFLIRYAGGVAPLLEVGLLSITFVVSLLTFERTLPRRWLAALGSRDRG